MEKYKVYIYLAHLCGCALENKTPKKLPEGLEWKQIYNSAKYHSVANLAFFAIDKLENKPEKTIYLKWKEARDKVVVKLVSLDLERNEILAAFEKEHIPYMNLKGIILKNYYEKPEMRFMADNDILYGKNYQKKVLEIMKSRGYKVKTLKGNHDIYLKEPFYNYEMHSYLMSSISEHRSYFEKVWDRAIKDKSNSDGYHMSNEDFYIYMIAHFYKHYNNRGSGIRSLIDIYVFLKKFESQIDWDYIHKELDILSLTSFGKDMKNLAQNLLGEQRLSKKQTEDFNYIIESGTYGNTENSVKKKVVSLKNSKYRYMLERLFPNRTFMKLHYKILGKIPILLPACYVLRLFKIINKWKFVKCEIYAVVNVKK